MQDQCYAVDHWERNDNGSDAIRCTETGTVEFELVPAYLDDPAVIEYLCEKHHQEGKFIA